MRSVLVTRPQPVAEEFAEQLRRAGYKAYIAPMMEYVGVDADFGDIARYQALVFTSAQAVQIFSSQSLERRLPVLAVGDATALAVRKSGFIRVYSAQGDSTDVAALLRSQALPLGLKKVLHLCSEDTPEDIASAVAGTGVEVVQRPVYKAAFLHTLPEDVVAALQRGAIDVVTMFSNRTAENFVKVLADKNLHDATAQLEAICISDRVAATLETMPWRAIRVARKPDIESVMEVLGARGPAAPADQERRRNRIERRQKPALRDIKGHVQMEAYMGPDRRKLYKRRQEERVMRERLKFINRSVLTAAFMFIAVVLAGVFLMAPEYARLGLGLKEVTIIKKGSPVASPNEPVGGILSRLIEEMQKLMHPLGSAAREIAVNAMNAVKNPSGLEFSQILDNVSALRQSAGGEEAVSEAMSRLRAALAGSVDRPEDFGRFVAAARQQDSTLDSLLGPVKKEDIAAGAMLLVLNEFRSNVSNSRPYAEDLALLQKFAGNNPRMNQSLQRLMPYAQKGVMSRQVLQAEFKGLATDILTAKLQGKDVSVQEEAVQRFNKLAAANTPEAVSGADTAAVVARAQVMLNKGDVKGAMAELQTLDNGSAQMAQPWMNNAEGYVVADQSSDDLTQGMLQSVAGGGSSVSDLMTMIKENLHGPSVPYISPALTHGASGGSDVLAPAGR